jgi:hypothetical protein
VFFALPVLSVVLNLRKILTVRGFGFDQQGFHFWRGTEATLVPWSDVRVVWIGYESPPHIPSVSIEGVVKDAIVDSLVKDRRRMALEIGPGDPSVLERHAALTPYTVDGQWRIPLLQVAGVVKATTRGVQTFHPTAWRGFVRRPWTGGIFRYRRRKTGPV